MEKGLVNTACTCANLAMKTWYLIPGPSPRKRGPRYKATPRLLSLVLRPSLSWRRPEYTYQVFIVRLVHVHAVVTRPFSKYERVWVRGYSTLNGDF